jgi:hypothetical protein
MWAALLAYAAAAPRVPARFVGLPATTEVVVVVEGDVDLSGLDVEARAGALAQVRLPAGQLAWLAGRPGLTRLREPWRARPKAEVTEGYAAVMTDDWRGAGVTGEGVTVGIVDVGFQGWEDLVGTELATTPVTDLSRGSATSSAHGAAVAEVVADFAPDADLYLASFSTDVELAEVLEQFADAGVDVVNASIGFDNVWHADGSSSLTQMADAAVVGGMAYFGAAGNENQRYVVGDLTLQEGEVLLAGFGAVPCYGGEASFRWSEEFGSAAMGLDLVLTNDDGTECARSEDVQDGTGDPYEAAFGADCTATVTASVVPVEGVDPTGLRGFLYCPDGVLPDYRTGTQDLTLPGDLREGVSVGGWDVASDAIPVWSSRGPTDDGRVKPDLVGPSGVSTATLGPAGFDGTSASTAHASGLAALWIQATGRFGEPGALKAWMLDGARDLGVQGPDIESGEGALRSGPVPPQPCGCAAAASPGVAALLGVGMLRRRP